MRVQRMPQAERDCVLIADEISLKKGIEYSRGEDKVFGVMPSKGFGGATIGGESQDLAGGTRGGSNQNVATHVNSALVLMVGGLRKKWKQAFYYTFSSSPISADNLKIIIERALHELKKVGLNVFVLSSDQGTNFAALKRNLGVTRRRPFFLFEGTKVFSIDDPPHLLKNTRNALLSKIIKSSVGTARWNDIVFFYKADKQQNCRLAPRLTDGHINMAAFGSRMRVRFASQVMSHSVAAGIATYVNFGKMPKEAGRDSCICRSYEQPV